MSYFKALSFLGLIFGTPLAMAETPLPDFYQFPIEDVGSFQGTPASIDLTSHPEAKLYRTKLAEGSRKGPNFAGHYTIVTIGCGTNCQQNWIIDAQTGKILYKFNSMFNTKYQVDSTLLIVNLPNPEVIKAYRQSPTLPFWSTAETMYLNWKNNTLDPLYQDKMVNVINAMPHP